MYLQHLSISGFRKFKSIDVEFNPEINIIVGANNSGKTTIIDAIRLLMNFSGDIGIRISTEDFFSPDTAIKVSGIFKGLTSLDESKVYESLVLKEGDFESHFHVQVDYPQPGKKIRQKHWCGENEGATVPGNFSDFFDYVYLPPLRDPNLSLKPGRNSLIAKLVRFFTSEEDREKFLALAKESTEAMKALNAIVRSELRLNKEISNITGPELTQNTELLFLEPEFDKLINQVIPVVETFSFEKNGLGYNNIIYTAATMGALQENDIPVLRGILIEEPEAHLHPQLQSLLLNYFNKATSQDIQVQIISTSHSPIFSSQAKLDSITYLHENPNRPPVPIRNLRLDSRLQRKLERYLDATRAELFFAQKLIIVEGLSEAILLPFFAQILGVNLYEESVTILNVEGLNFSSFLPLFQTKGITIPVAVLTDSDPDKDTYPELNEKVKVSSNVESLMKSETDLLKIFCSQKTLEYDLALYPENLPALLTALTLIKPGIGKKLKKGIAGVKDKNQAKYFYSFLFQDRNHISKPEFAESITESIINTKFIVPNYIENAIRHVTNK